MVEYVCNPSLLGRQQDPQVSASLSNLDPVPNCKFFERDWRGWGVSQWYSTPGLNPQYHQKKIIKYNKIKWLILC